MSLFQLNPCSLETFFGRFNFRWKIGVGIWITQDIQKICDTAYRPVDGRRILIDGAQRGFTTPDQASNLDGVARFRRLWWFAPSEYARPNARRKESSCTATSSNRRIFCARKLSNSLSLLFFGIIVWCGASGHSRLTYEVSTMRSSFRRNTHLRCQTYVLYNGNMWTRSKGGYLCNRLRPDPLSIYDIKGNSGGISDAEV